MKALARRALLFSLVYFASAELGNFLMFRPLAFSAYWPPSGLFVAVLLLSRPQDWPLLVLAAFPANLASDLLHGRLVWASLLFTCGNALEALTGAWLARRFVGQRDDDASPLTLDSPKQVFALIGLSGMLSTTLSASIGAGVVAFLLKSGSYWATWTTWWISDALSVMVFAPVVLLFARPGAWQSLRKSLPALKARAAEAAIWSAGLGVCIWLVCMAGDRNWDFLEYLFWPFLAWAALRFRFPVIVLMNLFLSLATAWSTSRGYGYFTAPNQDAASQALQLQAFIAISTCSTLGLAALTAERKQNDQQAHLQARLLDMVGEAVIATDLNGIVKYWNRMAGVMYGWNAQEAVGQEISTLIMPPDAASDGQRMIKMLQNRGAWSGMVMLRRRDGSLFPVLLTDTPIYDEHGQQTGIVGVSADITEYRQVEERLQASLLEKDVLLKELHHRVKNNLQIVNSILSLRADLIDDERALQVFQDCQNSVQAIALIHERIYQSSTLAEIDAHEYINDLVRHLHTIYEQQGQAVTSHIEAASFALDVERAIPCGLIITELFTNAIRHAFPPQHAAPPGGPQVWVSFEVQETCCRLGVRDNGVGLPPEFDLAERPSLGIQLVFLLSQQLKGDVQISGEGGTSFWIAFPR